MTQPENSIIPTQVILDYFNGRAGELKSELERVEDMNKRNARPTHPAMVYKLGKLAGAREELFAIQAFLEAQTADQAGNLTIDRLTDIPEVPY